jgi:hypothetical protein
VTSGLALNTSVFSEWQLRRTTDIRNCRKVHLIILTLGVEPFGHSFLLLSASKPGPENSVLTTFCFEGNEI